MKPVTTTRGIVRFWAPLSFTWLLMAVEGPTLTIFIARLPDATYNLAAYGVAIALAMLIESPVIHLLSTSVALAKDRAAEERLRRFMVLTNVVVTLGMITVCLPPVFDAIAYGVIGVAPEIGWRLHQGLLLLIPWPAAIGVRRFYQGLMIRNNQTRNVALGTVVRLVSMLITAVVFFFTESVEGITLGAAGLTAGVVGEALATRWMARGVVRSYRAQDLSTCEPPPTNRSILTFFLPLALTSVIGFVSMPIVSLFVSKAPFPVQSLAVLPVVNALIFLFRSFGFSYQEVGIAYLGESRDSYATVRRVAWYITIASTAGLLLVVLVTPLYRLVFGGIFGLSPSLVDVAYLPTLVQLVMPATAALFSLQRSVLIVERKTVHVTIAALIEVGGLTLVMAGLVGSTTWNGAIAGAVAIAVGRILGSGYSVVAAKKHVSLWSPQRST